MYGFSALPPVVGRYVSIFFGVCSRCGFSNWGMTGFWISFGYSGICGCGTSGFSGFSHCGVTGGGSFGFF